MTLALARRKTEAWITDRTGHKSSEMIYTHKRPAPTAAELELGWFAPLGAVIPKFAGDEHDRTRGGANGARASDRETSRVPSIARGKGTSQHTGNVDAVRTHFFTDVATPICHRWHRSLR